MKIHWASNELQGPLCGSAMGDNWQHAGRPQEVDCKKCKGKMCEDCFGVGIMNGKDFGVYCYCDYGTLRELQDGLTDHELMKYGVNADES